MSEVLSQNEIDGLLAALNSGELDVDQMQAADEKKVKVFKGTPKNFGNDL